MRKIIWQGLTAGAVGDDAAQNLAERLHARKSVLRGEGADSLPRAVRCRRRLPAVTTGELAVRFWFGGWRAGVEDIG